MMPESHQNAMEWLVIFVGLILVGIFLPFILKAFKKNSVPNSLQEKDNRVDDADVKSSAEFEPVETTVSQALNKTKENFWGRIVSKMSGQHSSQILDDIEEVLYTADLGSQTVQALLSSIDQELTRTQKKDIETVKFALKQKISDILNKTHALEQSRLLDKIKWSESGTTILMVVGVNGAGKTTSIGKLAALAATSGKTVLVAAGDTFRAAAQSQLKIWTDRAQVEVFAPENVSDPSAVAFEAVTKAKANRTDLVIIDTAGRLHTQINLMEELKKVKRVTSKVTGADLDNIWIVLDANSGQNALIQAREFHQALGLTGVVLTKMDGTAKGGVAVGLSHELQVPIKVIGIGEKLTDLRPFDPKEYVDSIL